MIYGWQFVALYSISCMIVPSIFWAVWLINNFAEKITLHNGEDIFGVFITTLFWPIALPGISITVWYERRGIRVKDRAKSIVSMRNMERMSLHDRSAMIDIPEKELKFLLKYYRKNMIELNKGLAELVRDELMNRTAEKELLGKRD